MDRGFLKFFTGDSKKEIRKITPTKVRVNAKLPTSRVSYPSVQGSYMGIKETLSFITPEYTLSYIPTLRKLFQTNSSVFRSATTLSELINSGIVLKFDPSVNEDYKQKINEHLKKAYKRWGVGTAGLHGIINKLILQAYISGAMSLEWVLTNDLDGVQYPAFINPEEIRVAQTGVKGQYEFYQIPKTVIGAKDAIKGGVKLNPFTYQYFGLFTDSDIPYGNPPFFSAIDDIQAQLKMLKNIGFVTDQLGIMGFLEILLDKPIQLDGESDKAYLKRLEKYLGDAKSAIKDGVKDGVVAGFRDEHEFDFHSTTKDTRGVSEIFNINHRMVSNGLLSPPQFLGGEDTGGETGLSIIFTMMLSQLKNIQGYLAEILERGIWLELLLAGFEFNWLEVSFKKSTMTDQVKEAQSEEIKIRSSNLLYAAGIIGQTEFANRHGYSKADKPEPRVPIDPQKVQDETKKKEERQKQDNESNKKTRAKRKDQKN